MSHPLGAVVSPDLSPLSLEPEPRPTIGLVCGTCRASIFGPLTIRPDTQGRWWAMNRREKGWASFGYPHAFLGDALDWFGVRLVGFGRDEHGLYVTAVSRVEDGQVNMFAVGVP